MWERVKKTLLFGGLDPDQYEKVQPLVQSENARTLRLAAIVQALYFGFSLISSVGVSSLADKRMVYAIGTVIPLAALLLYLLFYQKHPGVLVWLVRALSWGIFITALLCTLICTPAEMTILLLIFFFCVPMLFVVVPAEQIVLVLVTDIVYFIAAPRLKAPEVLSMDMIDVGIFSTLSVILGMSHLCGRYRRYWLETDAVDLAQIRYQAAFMDQLTGTLNRNAYNRDTEELAKAPVSGDFMYIAADLNGLKTANDTLGHGAGDELIIGAAECMTKCFSPYGKVYRMGGDEFAVVLNRKDRSAGELLDEFNGIVNAWHGSLVNKLSVSYGVVTGAEAEKFTFHEIELLADKRMYQSKSDYYKESGIARRIV